MRKDRRGLTRLYDIQLRMIQLVRGSDGLQTCDPRWVIMLVYWYFLLIMM